MVAVLVTGAIDLEPPTLAHDQRIYNLRSTGE